MEQVGAAAHVAVQFEERGRLSLFARPLWRQADGKFLGIGLRCGLGGTFLFLGRGTRRLRAGPHGTHTAPAGSKLSPGRARNEGASERHDPNFHDLLDRATVRQHHVVSARAASG